MSGKGENIMTKGKTAMTVAGEIGTDKLGSVLMHEHIYSSSVGIALNYPQLYREGTEERVLKDLTEAKAGGIDTIIDATPITLGRDVKGLKRMSEITGLNIMCITGWWGQPLPYAGPIPEEKWAQAFIDDVNIGCDGTDIKAGMLKAAMDKEGCTPWNILVHHAVGMAHQETGKKIMLHSYCPTETPRHQLRLLKEVGVEMNNVVVEHIPETTDMDFVKWIYDQGVWLGINRMPIIHLPGEYAVATETRIKFVKKMLDAGMGDRMLFSHDVNSSSTLFDYQPDEVRKYVDAMYPERYLFIKDVLFRKLEKMGIDYDYLWNLTIENPKRFFEG
jgi:phosphotriesterase-related protein